MIRLVQRRLIIPRGDTGSFSIPALGTVDVNDIVVFSIFDPLTHRKIFQKRVTVLGQVLNIVFSHNDTANLAPGKYVWDIKYYKNPTLEDDEIVDGEEVNSYYAGFSLPICEIRETAEDWPIYKWLAEYDLGDIVKNIASIILEEDYSLIINFTDGTSYKTASIRGDKGAPGTSFIPNIDSNGILSWSNTGGQINPPDYNLVEAVIAALPSWDGDYEVDPTIASQTLNTKGKVMQNDLIIKEISYTEVSNNSGGYTARIGFRG